MFNYFNPVKIHYGPYLEILSNTILDREEVVIVHGQKSMTKAVRRIKDILSRCHFTEVKGIRSNPTLDDINKYTEIPTTKWVIGIGGGSVLDYAKIIATNRHGQNFIAIPTTSGTGSEVTPWATVWDFEKKKKHSFDCTFARHAIIDPKLTLSLPPYETAYTGFDALSHAIEAYWSVHANPISDIYAMEAIDLIFSDLYGAWCYPEQIEPREAMSKASLYAGLAFSNTKTTAVHSVSYPMTLHYGIPHGVACALLLPSFLEYNSRSVSPKFYKLINRILGTSMAHLGQKIQRLAQRIKLPTTLKEAGIPRDGIDTIVKEGFHQDRVKNNPRPLTEPDLRYMLENIYE